MHPPSLRFLQYDVRQLGVSSDCTYQVESCELCLMELDKAESPNPKFAHCFRSRHHRTIPLLPHHHLESQLSRPKDLLRQHNQPLRRVATPLLQSRSHRHLGHLGSLNHPPQRGRESHIAMVCGIKGYL